MLKGVNMNNEIKNKGMDGIEEKTYKCQICSRETKNSVDAMTHYIDHGSSALEAVNALIKDQKIGRVSVEDKARISVEDKTTAQNGKVITATQGT
jgi:hypothetical protein